VVNVNSGRAAGRRESWFEGKQLGIEGIDYF